MQRGTHKRPGPAGGKRDRNRRDNEQRIAEAGLRLFLAHGSANVTIDQIATDAAIAKGSFYRYARDKADLVEQIMSPLVAELTSALDRCELALRRAHRNTLGPVYLQLANDLSLVVAGHASRVLFYLQEARAPSGLSSRAVHALGEQLLARAVVLTQIAREHRLIRDVAPEVCALAVLGAIEAILFAHLRGGRISRTDIPTVVNELVAIVLRGIRT